VQIVGFIICITKYLIHNIRPTEYEAGLLITEIFDTNIDRKHKFMNILFTYMYTSPFISLYKKHNLRGQKERKTATTREYCRGHEEGILISETWKLVVFILTWVDSWHHRAMKCFRRVWCEQKMCGKISENKELGSEPWGVATVDRHNHNKQPSPFQSLPLLFFLHHRQEPQGGCRQASNFFFRPSILPFVSVCVISKLKENWRLLIDFWLEHVPFCLLMVTAEYRSIYTRFAKATISAASFQVILVDRHSYDDGIMAKTFT